MEGLIDLNGEYQVFLGLRMLCMIQGARIPLNAVDFHMEALLLLDECA